MKCGHGGKRLDLCYDDEWDCVKDCVRQNKQEENDRIFVFCNGLNPNIDELKGRNLGGKPLPNLREVFSEVRREEEGRLVILNNNSNSNSQQSEVSSLVVKDYENEVERRNYKKGEKPWCDHCKKPWHTREMYWKIQGKPPNWKKRSGNENRAYQVEG